MNTYAVNLTNIISRYTPLLKAISEDDAAVKPQPGKWSKKEILGHLIDSAINNHVRAVRIQEDNGLAYPYYSQDFWVSVQRHHQRSWADLVSTWETFNKHFCFVITLVDDETLKNFMLSKENEPVTLDYILGDYITHLLHHLRQIVH